MRIENIELLKVKKDKVVKVGVEYPRSGAIDTVQIDLIDVRANDGIQVKYDFERDGWIIYQPKITHPHIKDNYYGYKEEWIESAFCPAWKHEEENGE